MKETKLQRAYRYYNRKYFGNNLPNPPEIKIKWGSLPDSEMGDFGEDEIRINRKLRDSRCQWRFTLLHEMQHAALDEIETRSDHGKEFQKGMLRLAKLGAFKRLW